MKYISSKLHFEVYFWSLVIFAVSINWSHSMTVIMTVCLGIIWLAQPEYKSNVLKVFKNPSIILFSSLFFMTLISLPFTKHISVSLKYVVSVLPVFLLSLFIGTSKKIPNERFALLMYLYVLSTVLSSIFNIIHYLTNYSNLADIRYISFFMSHIRYSLFINVSIFACFYYLFIYNISSTYIRVYLYFSLIWLTLFLFILQSITGIIIAFIVFTFIISYKIYKSKNRTLRIGLSTILLFIFSLITWDLLSIIHEFTNVKTVDTSKIDKYTPYGNKYEFNEKIRIVENGNYVFDYYSEKEMHETWDSVSSFHYDGLDKQNHFIKHTLIRYLASKNLRKDKNGILALSVHDRLNIENGIPNFKHENRFSFNYRIYQIIWEIDAYLNGFDPSGHSVTQRFEFWRCAVRLISDHYIVGVGTGNVRELLDSYYEKVGTQLLIGKRLYPHNQYLTIIISFGFCGLTIFLLGLIVSVRYEKKARNYFVLVYLAILLLSMLNEDTFETQYGIIFYAFWGALFIFGQENKQSIETIDSESMTSSLVE